MSRRPKSKVAPGPKSSALEAAWLPAVIVALEKGQPEALAARMRTEALPPLFRDLIADAILESSYWRRRSLGAAPRFDAAAVYKLRCEYLGLLDDRRDGTGRVRRGGIKAAQCELAIRWGCSLETIRDVVEGRKTYKKLSLRGETKPIPPHKSRSP